MTDKVTSKLQTRLREISESLMCREGAAHYCPNCDRTTWDAAMSLKVLADQLGSADETPANAAVDRTDIEIALEQAQIIEDDGAPTAAGCIRACAEAARSLLKSAQNGGVSQSGD